MKIITKYILKEFIKISLTCAFIFILLFMLSETFRIINLDNKPDSAFYYLCFYLLYQMPAWLLQISPMSLLLGFLFSYSNLSNSNEITAIKAGGINLNKIFFPVILFAFIFSVFALFANEYLIPRSNKKASQIYKIKIRGEKEQINNTYMNINYIGSNNSKYIAKSFDLGQKSLNKINIDQFYKNIFLENQIYADKAVFLENGKWKFINGVIRNFDLNTQNVSSEIKFNEKIINIHEPLDAFKLDEIEISEMSIHDLKQTIEKYKKNSIPFNKELTEMYHKVAFPFANTVVILIGIAFAASSIKNNKVISFAISLGISFMYWGITSIFISLGSGGVLPPMCASWITNIIFFIFSFIFMFRLKR